jgi:hypothetical protein
VNIVVPALLKRDADHEECGDTAPAELVMPRLVRASALTAAQFFAEKILLFITCLLFVRHTQSAASTLPIFGVVCLVARSE